MRLGFLASHNGSNMQALIDACKNGTLRATPAVVISNNGESGALRRAEAEGIPHYHLSSATHGDPEALDQAILDALLRHGTEVVALCGYMKKLGEKTLARFAGAILNIHPSLLPKFGGRGMYGIRVHEAVLAAGETETGATVHLVDAEYDTGPILAQIRVPVLPGDTPESLQARVLPFEHRLYRETLQRIAVEEIVLPGGKIGGSM
jgi:phosphoribosylglycinamide formyltransferase-1